MSDRQRRSTTVRAAIERRAILEGLPTRVARTCPWHDIGVVNMSNSVERIQGDAVFPTLLVRKIELQFGCGCVLRLQEEAGAVMARTGANKA